MLDNGTKAGILIPAYQPDEKLVFLVDRIIKNNIDVFVVNDGSVGCEDVFKRIKDKCNLISYEPNMGKGHALKTGMKYMYDYGYRYAVTADADGQHSLDDILNVYNTVCNYNNTLVIGSRNVNEMPPRSKFGNSLTRFLFKCLYRIDLLDTQTGLRGIPLVNVDKLVSLQGERYEYEMNMLVESGKLFDEIIEVPITTIYIEDNKTSHFNPIKDGIKIYKVLLKNIWKFLLSSVSSAAIDYAVYFFLFFKMSFLAVISTVVARVISSTYNYSVNKYVVFKTNSRKYNIVRYFTLAIFLLIVNSIIIYTTVDIMHLSAVLMKVIIETAMWVVSYFVQSRWAVTRE